jgi:hypothetical protein
MNNNIGHIDVKDLDLEAMMRRLLSGSSPGAAHESMRFAQEIAATQAEAAAKGSTREGLIETSSKLGTHFGRSTTMRELVGP